MAIKRYYASADNTITNAFQSNLTTRATGSNMGFSDILEVFSIYGQESSGSQELSRVLVKFDLSGNANTIRSDADNSKLTLSNRATAVLTALSKTAGEANTRTLVVTDVEGNAVTFAIDNSLTTSTATKIAFGNANSNASQFATNIAAAINAANSAGTLKIKASSTTTSTGDEIVILTMVKRGAAGNDVADISGTAVSDSVVTINNHFKNGSDGANFYLKLFNAEHAQTLPKDAILVVEALQTDWNEGRGLDMDGYTDLSNGDGSSNWEYANSGNGPATAATATITFTDATVVDQTIVITSTDGTEKTYTAKGSTSAGSGQFINTNAAAAATALASCITNAAGHNDKITVSDSGTGVLTLTQATVGLAGNTTITSGLSNVTVVNFDGGFDAGLGRVAWARQGGNFHQSPTFTASFAAGGSQVTGSGPTADLEVNVTDLIYEWYDYDGTNGKKNHGFIIRLTGSQEAKFTGNPAGTDHDGSLNNLTGSTRSFYTKRFFARSSEFFYKRPILEARWNDSIKDNTGNVYFSSSLAPQADNLNTIYMYNYVRGQLRNIPDIGTGPIYVQLYSGSIGNNSPSTSSILLPQGGGVNSATYGAADQPAGTVITGGYVATGIYSASFAITSSTSDYNPPNRLFSSDLTKVYAVWANTGKHDQAGRIEFLTSSFRPKKFDTPELNPNTTYSSNITNLKSVYSTNEQARFRVYVRQKDWNPTIYTKATSEAQTHIIDSGSYRFYRIIDRHDVIPFGTGSLLHTQMSYDVSGNYFDVDMGLFEPGYAYAIKLAYYNGSVGSYVEQPETFKFRVE